jgi:hypothetical protein
VPPELDRLVLRALAFDHQDRHASCAEVLAALTQIATRHHYPTAFEPLVATWVQGCAQGAR